MQTMLYGKTIDYPLHIIVPIDILYTHSDGVNTLEHFRIQWYNSLDVSF